MEAPATCPVFGLAMVARPQLLSRVIEIIYDPNRLRLSAWILLPQENRCEPLEFIEASCEGVPRFHSREASDVDFRDCLEFVRLVHESTGRPLVSKAMREQELIVWHVIEFADFALPRHGSTTAARSLDSE